MTPLDERLQGFVEKWGPDIHEFQYPRVQAHARAVEHFTADLRAVVEEEVGEWKARYEAMRDHRDALFEQRQAAEAERDGLRGRLEDKVTKFKHWLETTPHDGLQGDSKVAYDAQVRIVRQFFHWVIDGDDYLDACIELAYQRLTAPAPSSGEQP